MLPKREVRDRCSWFSAKKGQVTLFIIAGILVLLALVLVIVLQQKTSRFLPGEIIPTPKGKIERFISTCISDIGQEGLLRMGLQGGYVQLPDEIQNDGNLQLRIAPSLGIPYWAVGESTFIPSLEDLQQRLNQHMEENLQRCVFGLQAFQETYTLTEKSPVTAHTEITDTQVLFQVHWEIEAAEKSGEAITRLEEHQAASPIRLKLAYETAQKMVEREMKDFKMEDLTQDLLALDHPSLPLSGFEVSCREKSWPIFQVKKTLQDMLRVNIREVQLAGLAPVEFPEELSYYQHHYVWDVGEIPPDFDVQLSYENKYPFTFDVRPRSGSALRSTTLGGKNPVLSLFCLQNWKFVYDVSYPVVVKIRDLQKESNPYFFQMAFTVHVKRNLPDRSGKLPSLPPTRVPFTSNDEEFCRDLRIPLNLLTSSLVDNGEGVYFRDPLEQVALSFTCLRYTCPLGESAYNYALAGNVAGTRRNVPYCVGGILRGEKTGYTEATQRVVTHPEDQVELELRPLKKIPLENIHLVTHEFTSPQVIGPGRAEKEATIILKLKHLQEGKEIYSEERVISPELLAQWSHPARPVSGVAGAGIQDTLDFLAEADFTYQLEITLLKGENILGGYQAAWKVPWQELEPAQNLTFHLLSKEKGAEEERLALAYDLAASSPFVPPPEWT